MLDSYKGKGEIDLKKIKMILPLALAFTFGLQLSPSFPEKTLSAAETRDEQHNKTIAERRMATWFIENITKNKPEEAVKYFSKELQTKQSSANIQNWWQANTAPFGSVKKIGEAVIHSSNQVHTNVAIPISFEKGSGTLLVRFNKERKQDDMFFKPEQPPISYPTPSYDNPKLYIEKEVSFGKEPYLLPGTLTLPTQKRYEKTPVVVLVHGSGPSDRDSSLLGLKPLRDLSVGLASEGIAVLRYEKRSFEHNLKFAGESKINVNMETTDDAVSAVEMLSKRNDIDPNNIFILGHSLGGMMMPRILDQSSDLNVRGAITFAAPARTLTDILLHQYKYLGQPKEVIDFLSHQFDLLKDPGFNPEHPPADYVYGTPFYWHDLVNWNPVEVSKQQNTPLFVVQGERDYQVTAKEDFSVWKNELSNHNNVSFKTYPKLNHFFTEGEGDMSTPNDYLTPANIPSYVIDDVANWIHTTRK